MSRNYLNDTQFDLPVSVECETKRREMETEGGLLVKTSYTSKFQWPDNAVKVYQFCSPSLDSLHTLPTLSLIRGLKYDFDDNVIGTWQNTIKTTWVIDPAVYPKVLDMYGWQNDRLHELKMSVEADKPRRPDELQWTPSPFIRAREDGMFDFDIKMVSNSCLRSIAKSAVGCVQGTSTAFQMSVGSRAASIPFRLNVWTMDPMEKSSGTFTPPMYGITASCSAAPTLECEGDEVTVDKRAVIVEPLEEGVRQQSEEERPKKRKRTQDAPECGDLFQ